MIETKKTQRIINELINDLPINNIGILCNINSVVSIFSYETSKKIVDILYNYIDNKEKYVLYTNSKLSDGERIKINKIFENIEIITINNKTQIANDKIYKLIDKNGDIKEYINSKEIIYSNIADELKKLSIVNKNGELTELGKLLFLKDYCNQEIEVQNKSLINNIRYVETINHDNSLFRNYVNIINYLNDTIPTYRNRSSLVARLSKPEEIDIAELLSLAFEYHDFNGNRKMNIELNFPIIKINCKNNNKGNITNKGISKILLNTNCNKIVAENKYIIKKNKNNDISIYYDIKKGENKSDICEKQILKIIIQNGKVTRKLVNEELCISPRSANIKIKNLVNKKIIKTNGIGKTTYYTINKSADLNKYGFDNN